ncbi:hypothetical protein [Oryza sativa Japonica Group]|uniref:Uncharacterized protein n=1 Tax=Oryza sativa subsp. japonica TaxID=39947 RepID=Q5JK96_ORYSJ|nr:hypothetical protein [Oryza sativa Japonica Group]
MEEEEEEEEAEGWQEKEVVVVMKDISGAHREIRLCLLDEYESEELGTSHCANPVENLEALCEGPKPSMSMSGHYRCVVAAASHPTSIDDQIGDKSYGGG